MKRKDFIMHSVFLLFAIPLCLFCVIFTPSCTGSDSSSSKWKKVENVNEFKKQFIGTTWTCYSDGIHHKFVVESSDRIAMYFKLELPNSGWNKQEDCNTYEVSDFVSQSDYIRGNAFIRVILDGNNGQLQFAKDGTPGHYYNGLGLDCGLLDIE